MKKTLIMILVILLIASTSISCGTKTEDIDETEVIEEMEEDEEVIPEETNEESTEETTEEESTESTEEDNTQNDGITSTTTEPVITTEKIKTVETIPFETFKREDVDLDKGLSSVLQEGENGEKTIITLITYSDGEEVSRELISETVTKEPVNKIIIYGTRPAKE